MLQLDPEETKIVQWALLVGKKVAQDRFDKVSKGGGTVGKKRAKVYWRHKILQINKLLMEFEFHE